MSPEACKDLPTAVLDHQANALRNRLGRRVDYGERGRDLLELKNVKGSSRGDLPQSGARMGRSKPT